MKLSKFLQETKYSKILIYNQLKLYENHIKNGSKILLYSLSKKGKIKF